MEYTKWNDGIQNEKSIWKYTKKCVTLKHMGNHFGERESGEKSAVPSFMFHLFSVIRFMFDNKDILHWLVNQENSCVLRLYAFNKTSNLVLDKENSHSEMVSLYIFDWGAGLDHPI